jgi:ATP-dependent DNA ligase
VRQRSSQFGLSVCVRGVMAKCVRTVGISAEKSAMPGFIKPQLATLKARAPSGNQWLHEIKFDGYRVQIHLNKGKRKVYTRNGLDWTGLDETVLGHCRRTRHSRPGDH